MSPNVRTPAALRDKELPMGRGFIIEAGQATMIQCANPYSEESSEVMLPGGQQDEDRRPKALDKWVANIRDKYLNQHARWAPATTSGSEGDGNTANGTSPMVSAKAQRMLGILQSGMRKELEHLQGENGNGNLITLQLVLQDINKWNDEAVLTDLMRELYVKQSGVTGPLEEIIRGLAAQMDADGLMLNFEGDSEA